MVITDADAQFISVIETLPQSALAFVEDTEIKRIVANITLKRRSQFLKGLFMVMSPNFAPALRRR
nr:hypothetical protein [uncultured bacterium]